MDAQEQHDYQMSLRKGLEPGSRERLEALLAKKGKEAKRKKREPDNADPIEWALKNYPGLTREKAEQMAQEFGF